MIQWHAIIVDRSRLLICIFASIYSKIVELEEELRVVGNNLKSLEVSEEKVSIVELFSSRSAIFPPFQIAKFVTHRENLP